MVFNPSVLGHDWTNTESKIISNPNVKWMMLDLGINGLKSMILCKNLSAALQFGRV